MEEYIDIWSEDGLPTGKYILKDEAHQKGLFHPTVHIWMYTNKSEVLFQQRGSQKETFPGFWDVSVAGHIMTGETIKSAAIREVKEEIGLSINEHQLLAVDIRKNINRHPNGIIDCEFQHVFLCELLVDINTLQIQEEEVDGIQLLSLDEFEYEVNHLDTSFSLVPADYSYYTFVIENVRKLL